MPPVSSVHAMKRVEVLYRETNNETAGIDDDIQRRDSMHALINSLPDAHYATLRAIILVRSRTRTQSLFPSRY